MAALGSDISPLSSSGPLVALIEGAIDREIHGQSMQAGERSDLAKDLGEGDTPAVAAMGYQSGHLLERRLDAPRTLPEPGLIKGPVQPVHKALQVRRAKVEVPAELPE